MKRTRLHFLTATLLALAPVCAAQQPATDKGFSATAEIVKAATDGQVWGALIFASSAAEAKAVKTGDLPKELEDLPKRLGKVFDFKSFELMGQHTQQIFREYESWVVPSKDLFLKVDSKGPAEGGGMNLHLQFWQEQQVLLKTDAVLRAGSPLFIGGPKWRGGQLVFVLMLKKGNDQ